jgi:hypothetical protein
MLTGDEVGHIIKDWEEEWKTTVLEIEKTETQSP